MRQLKCKRGNSSSGVRPHPFEGKDFFVRIRETAFVRAGDLLRRGDGTFEAIREDLRAILATPVPPDAVMPCEYAAATVAFGSVVGETVTVGALTVNV